MGFIVMFYTENYCDLYISNGVRFPAEYNINVRKHILNKQTLEFTEKYVGPKRNQTPSPGRE